VSEVIIVLIVALAWGILAGFKSIKYDLLDIRIALGLPAERKPGDNLPLAPPTDKGEEI